LPNPPSCLLGRPARGDNQCRAGRGRRYRSPHRSLAHRDRYV
jgi:hypothetical protein